jgi:tRNA nucleotidyltransferase (CCA-adding enzyme)
MNAMAWDASGVVDLFNGRRDIGLRLVRAVGDPCERFGEDPLRMLRAGRFVSDLGFAVEERTEAAAERLSHRILSAARERWMTELDKLLVGPSVRQGLEFLARTGVLSYILPELSIQVGFDQNSPWHDLSLWEHTLGVVESVPPDLELRWAALLHDIGKPFVRVEKPGRSVYARHDLLGADMVERIALTLKWSRARREHVHELVLRHLSADSPLRAADDANKRAIGDR